MGCILIIEVPKAKDLCWHLKNDAQLQLCLRNQTPFALLKSHQLLVLKAITLLLHYVVPLKLSALLKSHQPLRCFCFYVAAALLYAAPPSL